MASVAASANNRPHSLLQITHGGATAAPFPLKQLHVSGKSSRTSQERADDAVSVLDLRGGFGGKDRNGKRTSRRSEDNEVAQTSVALARLCLLAVAFLYGSMNVGLRLLNSLPDPPAASVVGMARGIITAICFLPALTGQLRASDIRPTQTSASPPRAERGRAGPKKWSLRRDAFELAFWNVSSVTLLTAGLSMVSSSVRASFLAQTSVVITPIISLVAGKPVDRSVWGGSAVALAGLVALSTGGAAPTESSGRPPAEAPTAADPATSGKALNGDLMILSCSACWSMYLHRFSAVAGRHERVPLQAVSCAMRAGMYTVCFIVAAARHAGGVGGWQAVWDMWRGWRDWKAWGLLAFTSVGPGAMAAVLQQKGQAVVSASESNVILSSEPVFSGVFAWIILGEIISPKETVGGALLLLAPFVASGILGSFGNNNVQTTTGRGS